MSQGRDGSRKRQDVFGETLPIKVKPVLISERLVIFQKVAAGISVGA